MQKIFIARKSFDDLQAISLDKRQDFYPAFLKVLSSENSPENLLAPVSEGDPQVYSLPLSSGFSALFRKFPDAWILMAVAPQDRLQSLARSLRFAWDGETTDLLRVVAEGGKLSAEKPFARFTADELKAWGVPQNLTAKVQNASEEDELRTVEGDVTPRTFFKLLEIFETYKQYPDDLKILDQQTPKNAMASMEEEIGESLEDLFHSDRFFLIEQEFQLKHLVTETAPAWLYFPLPDQKKWMTRNFKAPVLIRGVAGSGKTTLALLRTHYLAEEILGGNDQSILITTPYRYATAFLQEDLQDLSARHKGRIEIQDIYSWAKSYLESQGVHVETDAALSLELLKDAIDACRPGMPNMTNAHLDFNFVRDEISMVIKGKALHSQPDYLALSRRGFGTPLNSEERRHLWRIYLKYQSLLASKNLMDLDDLLVETYKRMIKITPPKKYAAIIVDDAQDVPPVALKIFHHIARQNPNGLFMLSDVSQKFTRSGDTLATLGIDCGMRAPLLRTNLRTTREISEAGLAVLGNTAFDEVDGSAPAPAVSPEVRKRGVKPVMLLHENEEQSIIWVLELINELTSESYGYSHGDILLLARTNKFLTLLEVNLTQAQIPCHNFKKVGHDRRVNKVKLANYSDCKGMEFPVVILTEATEGILPQLPSGVDAEELTTHLSREQRLLFCGINRSQDLLYVTGLAATPCRFITSMAVVAESEGTENFDEAHESFGDAPRAEQGE